MVNVELNGSMFFNCETQNQKDEREAGESHSYSIVQFTNLRVPAFDFSFQLIDTIADVRVVRRRKIEFAAETAVDHTARRIADRPGIG